jgi:hypothetical protein
MRDLADFGCHLRLGKLVTSAGPAIDGVAAKCNRTGNTFHLAVQRPFPRN